MSTEAKRTTIYLSADLEKRLDRLKQEKYYKESQSSMISTLIRLGAEVDERDIKKLPTTSNG